MEVKLKTIEKILKENNIKRKGYINIKDNNGCIITEQMKPIFGTKILIQTNNDFEYKDYEYVHINNKLSHFVCKFYISKNWIDTEIDNVHIDTEIDNLFEDIF